MSKLSVNFLTHLWEKEEGYFGKWNLSMESNVRFESIHTVWDKQFPGKIKIRIAEHWLILNSERQQTIYSISGKKNRCSGMKPKKLLQTRYCRWKVNIASTFIFQKRVFVVQPTSTIFYTSIVGVLSLKGWSKDDDEIW